MRRPVLRILRGALIIGAGALVVRQIAATDRRALLATLDSLGPWVWFVPLPFFCGMLLDTAAWRRLLRQMGATVSGARLLAIRLGAEALLLSLPGGAVAAEAAKPPLLARAFGVPVEIGAASVVVKKALVVSSGAVSALLAWVVGGHFLNRLDQAVGWRSEGVFRAALLGTVVVLGLLGGGMMAFLASPRLGRGVQRVLARSSSRALGRVAERIGPRIAAFDAAAAGIVSCGRHTLAVPFVLVFLQWLMEAFDTWLLANLCGLRLGFTEALAFESLSGFLRSSLPMLPAGLGLVDTGLMLLAQAAGASEPVVTGAALVFTKRAKEVFWIVTGYVLLFATKGSDVGPQGRSRIADETPEGPVHLRIGQSDQADASNRLGAARA